MSVPRIAITPGEPAGIGPDITLMAARHAYPAELVAVADPDMLRERAERLGLPVQIKRWDPASLAEQARPHTPDLLQVLPCALAAAARPGELDAGNAGYVLATLQAAIDGCMDHKFAAMVTGPVQKSVINDGGIAFTGHTEFLADATGTPRVVMMLATRELRVALATTHLPLAEVPAAITSERLRETLVILHHDLRSRFGLAQPRIAVLGLNPHAGESGHLGREELDTIIPLMDELKATGMDLLGPLPADTAFNPRVLDQVDAVFAMYHDQGLPVLKYSGFGRAINITLGLPIIRTSVDHGTALDLAGTGEADDSSLVQAITTAIDMGNIATAESP